MRTADVFAGTGAFAKGMERAGHGTVFLCEDDPDACAVLDEKFPATERHGDVRTLERLPADAELVCAGFPCQNVSAAGGKQGLAGPRSAVVQELLRLVERDRPPVVVLENVRFLLHLGGGCGIGTICGRLERAGYRWAYRTVDALGFGLAQRRLRLILCAVRADWDGAGCAARRDPRAILLTDRNRDSEAPARYGTAHPGRPAGFYWTEGRAGHGITDDAVPTLKAGSGIGVPCPPAVLLPDDRVVTPDTAAAEQLQGLEPGYTGVLTRLGRGNERWRLIGNAIPVPVAEWIGRRIAEPGRYVEDRNGRLRRLYGRGGWPPAAWNVDGGPDDRYGEPAAGTVPLSMPPGRISEMRPERWPDLSARALRGFLKRAHEGNLEYPERFLERIEGALRRSGYGRGRRRSSAAEETEQPWN